jgi:bifunctional non-homologous end joining protein LigD
MAGGDFNGLHSRIYDDAAVLLAFDLLELDGEDLREQPLIERKARLKKLLGRKRTALQYVEHLEGDGQEIFEHVCRMGLEGIVSKRSDSHYRAGTSKSWVKIKNRGHPALMRVAEAHALERVS